MIISLMMLLRRANSTLVAGLVVGVPAAQSVPVDRDAADTGRAAATTSRTAPDPQKLITLLSQVESRLKQAQHDSKVSPADLGGLTGLLSGIEAAVLSLLNTLTSTLGLPPLPSAPGTPGGSGS